MNKELVGKMVYVPRHNFGAERVMYLWDVSGGLMSFIDCQGDGLRLHEDAVELREATKKEVAEDFMYCIDGKRRDLSELGDRGLEIIEELYKVSLEKCQKQAGRYERF